MRDESIRAALEQHDVPADSPTFFDDLWELVHAREHAALVRWRRISVVLAGVAVAALAAASVLAAPHGSGVVDSTMTCTLQIQGGLPVFDIGARPRSTVRGKPPYTFTYPAELSMTTGGDVFFGPKLFMAQSSAKGYVLDRSACKSGTHPIPFSRSGLRLVKRTSIGYDGLDLRCVGPARVIARIRLVQNANGEPVGAQMAVHVARSDKPLAYIVWNAGHLTAYGSTACDTHGF
jgi:hypothetical protein